MQKSETVDLDIYMKKMNERIILRINLARLYPT